MDWNDKKLPAPQWLALAALALLILVKFVVGGRMVVVTGLVQLATIIGATAIGFAIGWLCSPKASAFRLIAAFAAVGLILLIGIGDAGLMGASVTGILALIGFFAALGYWAGTALKSFAQRPTTFGSAQWATLPYLQENGIIGESGIRLGRFATDEGSEPLHYDSDRHLLTIAPTRARKGTAAIIPNLLTYSGSALVVDPKGENAMITAAARKAMGQEICVVDPWMITGSDSASRFNPLDWLVQGMSISPKMQCCSPMRSLYPMAMVTASGLKKPRPCCKASFFMWPPTNAKRARAIWAASVIYCCSTAMR